MDFEQFEQSIVEKISRVDTLMRSDDWLSQDTEEEYGQLRKELKALTLQAEECLSDNKLLNLKLNVRQRLYFAWPGYYNDRLYDDVWGEWRYARLRHEV